MKYEGFCIDRDGDVEVEVSYREHGGVNWDYIYIKPEEVLAMVKELKEREGG